jgi:uncharacterized protein YndB with AHSA1/START domain
MPARTGATETVEVEVRATPAVVFEVVSDPLLTPCWSPEVIRVRWLRGDDRAQVGARFVGTSRSRFVVWRRTCTITAYDPPRRFAYQTVPNLLISDSTIWTFEVEARGDHSALRQTYELVTGANAVVRLGARLGGRPHSLAVHMRETVTGMARAAEVRQGSLPSWPTRTSQPTAILASPDPAGPQHDTHH